VTLPEGAEAWRIEYATTAPDNAPATAVATVLAPTSPPDHAMPVIAWDHGAVGLAQQCLPSAMADPWMGLPALADVVAQGWMVVATDYQTNAAGVHPFLIGEGEARSTLDAVRALRQMPDLLVDDRTVVWGHSQGGHAALWTGMIAPIYAPDVTINGIVALSPVTGLVSLLNRQTESSVAPLLGSWLATAYSTYYPDVAYSSIVTPAAQEAGKELAGRCPSEPLDGVVIALLIRELGDEPLLVVPAPAAFRDRLQENEPEGAITAPVVIAQGLEDVVVRPEVTAGFVAARCADGAAISYWQLPGQEHLTLVQSGSPVEDPLIIWTQERFAGKPTTTSCTGRIIVGES
jgi:pimeloyl-ACP methyl ester carboxylesterase